MIRCLAQRMGEHTGRSLLTPLRRRAETHAWRGVRMSCVRRSTVWTCVNHSHRAALLGFVYLWPIVSFLSSHLTGPRTFPKVCV